MAPVEIQNLKTYISQSIVFLVAVCTRSASLSMEIGDRRPHGPPDFFSAARTCELHSHTFELPQKNPGTMTTRTHNEFLDIPDSDDDISDRGYDSESKSRAVKRRRADPQDLYGLNDESDEDENAQEKEEDEDEQEKESRKRQPDEDHEDGGAYLDTTKSSTSKSKSKSSSTKPLKAPKKNKEGVIYLSSLPPYLRPFALKRLIESRGFTGITKVFLSPMVPSSSAPKRRSNKRKLYSDGWIAFASKKTAKICAETLNATTVGGRGYYRDDVWNMKYLTGLKWDHLTEQIARERAERESKRRMEDTRARSQDKAFVAGVEAGRVADGMARKNEEKRKRKLESGEGDEQPEKKPAPVRRRFVQNDVVAAKPEQTVLGDDAKRVLGKIF